MGAMAYTARPENMRTLSGCLPHSAVQCLSPGMDSSIRNLPDMFGELSRLSDGVHTVYLRNDSHNFFEIHHTGASNLFTSAVVAFIPNVVIKLQTPLVSSTIAAVPSQQESAAHTTHRRYVIVDNLCDIINHVKDHNAAFIREDASLAVWADEMQPALAALRQVLKEFGVPLDKHEFGHVVALSDTDGVEDPSADRYAFDEFIQGYDDPADKVHDESTSSQTTRTAPIPLGTLDVADDLEAMYAVRRKNLFDSLSLDSVAHCGNSTFLSSAVSTGMSRQYLNSAPPPACAFSSRSFDLYSPTSSGSPSDSRVLSTPLAVASSVPSLLSTWNSPQLPIVLEPCMEQAPKDTPPVDSMNPSTICPSIPDRELELETPGKRKRSPEAKQVSSAAGTARSYRTSRNPTPKALASPLSRARNVVSMGIAPSSPTSNRVVSPLPARTSGQSRHSSTSSTASAVSNYSSSRTAAISASKPERAPAAQPTVSRVKHAPCFEGDSEDEDEDELLEDELLEADDSGSEYVADPSELELDDDDDYRPAKRTRSLSCSARATSLTSPVVTIHACRKDASSKFVSKKNQSKKKKSSAYGGKKKLRTMSEAPRPTCVWCDKEFTRKSDVLRHEKTSCKLYPFDRTLKYCTLCDKEISRNDSVIRHQDSGDCERRQHELRKLREQGILPPKVVNKKTAHSAGPARKAVPSRRAASA